MFRASNFYMSVDMLHIFPSFRKLFDRVVKVVIIFKEVLASLERGSFIFVVLSLETAMRFYVFAWDVFVKTK